jgi:hypothetical protein
MPGTKCTWHPPFYGGFFLLQGKTRVLGTHFLVHNAHAQKAGTVTGLPRRRTGFVHILSDSTDLSVNHIIQIASPLPIRASLLRVVSLTD